MGLGFYWLCINFPQAIKATAILNSFVLTFGAKPLLALLVHILVKVFVAVVKYFTHSPLPPVRSRGRGSAPIRAIT